MGKYYQIGEKVIEGHFFTRFMSKKTECWFFNTGIGDQTMCNQMGDSFLEYCEENGDPDLGRIMFSMGIGPGAYEPYKGDFNVCWPWGVLPQGMKAHLDRLTVKQDLIIGPWKERREAAEAEGIASMPMYVGVGRIFRPLSLNREGLGYAGMDNKSPEQKHIVLGPALKRKDFEWHAHDITSHWVTTEELNEWYNKKQILFGMIQEDRHRVDYMPSRFPETLASGTPLIIYEIPSTEAYLGYRYPYMTDSYERTETLIEEILADYESVLEEIATISEYIRAEHSYKTKLGALFDKLRELK